MKNHDEMMADYLEAISADQDIHDQYVEAQEKKEQNRKDRKDKKEQKEQKEQKIIEGEGVEMERMPVIGAALLVMTVVLWFQDAPEYPTTWIWNVTGILGMFGYFVRFPHRF